jgi:hypothetical protein
MMFGVPVEPVMQIIPPRQANFTNYGICTSDCTADLPAEGKIQQTFHIGQCIR